MGAATSPLPRLLAADAAGIDAAVAWLSAGGIAAIPTETVYGLAADAADAAAVAAVYAAKGRPAFNPLIVHVADRAMAERYARFDALAERLGAAFWPGPLTLVLPMKPAAPLASLVTAGLGTVALRVPAHPAPPPHAPPAWETARRCDWRTAPARTGSKARSSRCTKMAGFMPARRPCSGMAPFRARRWRRHWGMRSRSRPPTRRLQHLA